MNDIEAIRHLEQSGQYRVIERLKAPDTYTQGAPATARTGIVIDVEATGLDTSRDKIIELGFIAFEYDAHSGQIYNILHSYGGFEDPGEPLDQIIKQITGISDEMVAGKKLDDEAIIPWLEKADLFIAHNASFDRQMLERRFPVTAEANWGCTFSDINWVNEDIASLKLDYIAYKLGYFFDGHRAVNDAQATLHLLTKTLPVTDQLAMHALLQNAREVNRRYFAIGAPFDKKDELKARAYRWLPNHTYSDRGKQKKGVWSRSVKPSEIATEEQWLAEQIYSGGESLFSYRDITARERYSKREY